MSNLVLVTGATSGIGKATALWAAERGHDLVLIGGDVEQLETIAGAAEETGARTRALALDLAQRDSIATVGSAVEELEATSGPLTGLVNHAGSMLDGGAFGAPPDESDAAHRNQMELLFHAPRQLAEAFVPWIIEQGRGAVVNIVSAAGFRAFPGVAALTAAKHALLGWTRAAALELASTPVAVSAVCPDYVSTPALKRRVEAFAQASGRDAEVLLADLQARNPAGEFVYAKQVAAIVLDLLTTPRNGTLTVLDGGHLRELNDLR